MMDLVRFKATMEQLDTICGFAVPMFDCGVVQVDANTFGFSYDALCSVVVRFEEGKISEWAEVLPEEIADQEPTFTFATFGEWFDHQKEMGFPSDMAVMA